MRCVSTFTYYFVLDGGSFGFLAPERGIRQGDPLLPYLFIFCLVESVCGEESNENNTGLQACGGAPSVSHLMFTDDTIIFCNANKHSTESIHHILKQYEEASVQVINY